MAEAKKPFYRDKKRWVLLEMRSQNGRRGNGANDCMVS